MMDGSLLVLGLAGRVPEISDQIASSPVAEY